MPDNPLLRLHDFGQSVWLDFTRRGMTRSGQLRRMIDEDGVRGVTSNPSIFEKAIGWSGTIFKASSRSIATGWPPAQSITRRDSCNCLII